MVPRRSTTTEYHPIGVLVVVVVVGTTERNEVTSHTNSSSCVGSGILLSRNAVFGLCMEYCRQHGGYVRARDDNDYRYRHYVEIKSHDIIRLEKHGVCFSFVVVNVVVVVVVVFEFDEFCVKVCGIQSVSDLQYNGKVVCPRLL